MRPLLVFCCLCLASPAARADATDDFITAHLAKKQIPGVAIMVRDRGKLVRAQGYGMANLEHGVAVKPETVFQSGSVGKQLTAMAVMTLVDERKLSLDDPVAKYLPVPATWAPITVRHLLTHTSGLGDYPESFSLQKDYTEDELLRMVVATPLAFRPGEKWAYSNLGYVTLGILIHKVSGQFYGDLLTQRVFRPLGMTTTRIISEADIIPNRAAGYRLVDGVLKNQEWVSPTINSTADGSLYFTVLDLARWDEGLEAGKIVGRASYDAMWSPVRLNDGSTAPYGFGWSLGKNAAGHRLIEHGGEWQGFTAYIARHPDEQLSIAVLCNRAGGDPAYIARRVAGFYRPELAPKAHQAVRVDVARLRAYVGRYRLDDRFTLEVMLSGDGRLRTVSRSETHEIIPESETDFFEEDSDRTYRFVKGPDGKVTALVIHVPEVLTFRRLP